MKWRIYIAVLAMLGIAGVAPSTDVPAQKPTTSVTYTTPGTDGCEICWD